MKRARTCCTGCLLAVLLPIVVGGGWLGHHRLVDRLIRPTRISLPAPELWMADVALDSVSEWFLWSPSGKRIAIGGVLADAPMGSRDDVNGLVVIEVAHREVLARIPTSYWAARTATWSSDDRLWVPNGGSWDIYAHPFGEGPHDCAKAPIDLASEAPRWTFHPDSQTLVSIPETRKVTVWRAGEKLCSVVLHPKVPTYSHGERAAFAPDGSSLALTLSGFTAPDVPGEQELWVLRIDTGDLHHLHTGKSRWWQLFDYPVQHLQASWDPDGKTIVFGDNRFGVAQINALTGRHRRLLPRGWAGCPVRVSPTGEWMGFYCCGYSCDPGPNQSLGKRLGVATRDGELIAFARTDQATVGIDGWGWHPTENTVAWAPSVREGPTPLYLWRLGDPPSQ